jgi:hypothetical protein
MLGVFMILLGLGAAFYALLSWYDLSFGEVREGRLIKVVCAASLLAVLGFQFFFSSFFLYLLDQSTKLDELAHRQLQSTEEGELWRRVSIFKRLSQQTRR